MDEQTFWRLIEESKAECVPESEEEEHQQDVILQRKLEELRPDEIVEFDRMFRVLHARAYRWDLWAAAYVIEGGCGDDGFTDFRSGLIGLGREAYNEALRDPETLARQPDRGVDFSNESMMYAASIAYESVTGEEMPETPGGDRDARDREPAGEPFDEDTVHLRFPALHAKFGDD